MARPDRITYEPDKDVPDLQPGEFQQTVSRKGPDGRGLLLACPLCGKWAFVEHTVTGPEDAPTCHPSLRCPFPPCDAHYWIKEGRIEWC